MADASNYTLDCDYEAVMELADTLRLFATSEDAAGAKIMPGRKKLLEQAEALRNNGTLGEIPLSKPYPEQIEDLARRIDEGRNKLCALADAMRDAAQAGIDLENRLRKDAETVVEEAGIRTW